MPTVIRPQRIMPADAAIVNGQAFNATGVVKANADGLNIPVPVTIGAGLDAASEVLDVSGYKKFAIVARANVGGGAIRLNIAIISPDDANTVLTQINTGQVTAGAATFTNLVFGEMLAVTNFPMYLIVLAFVNTTAGNVTLDVTPLLCSSG